MRSVVIVKTKFQTLPAVPPQAERKRWRPQPSPPDSCDTATTIGEPALMPVYDRIGSMLRPSLALKVEVDSVLTQFGNKPFLALHVRRSQSWLDFDEMKAWAETWPDVDLSMDKIIELEFGWHSPNVLSVGTEFFLLRTPRMQRR